MSSPKLKSMRYMYELAPEIHLHRLPSSYRIDMENNVAAADSHMYRARHGK